MCYIANRLQPGEWSKDADTLAPNSPKRSFKVLAKEVREAIDEDPPEVALDRLDTFAVIPNCPVAEALKKKGRTISSWISVDKCSV